MIDREKVIKGLEELSAFLFREYGRVRAEESAVYYDRFLAVENALTLLKEQEPRPPRVTENAYGTKFYFCPRCARPIIPTFKSAAYCKPRHCEDCGQAVKWE